MPGNVIEWTKTFFSAQLSQEIIDSKGPREAGYRTRSESSWFEDGDTDYNVGFRCVSP